MPRDKVLPPKLKISQVIDYLDMDRLNKDGSYEQLCDHINEKDFNLYIKEHVFKVYNNEDVILDDEKNFVAREDAIFKSLKSNDLIVRNIHYLKQLFLFDSNRMKNTNNHKPFRMNKIIDINTNTEYFLRNDDNSIGIEVSETELYARRDEVNRFRKLNIYQDTLDSNKLNTQDLNAYSESLFTLPPYLDKESEFYSEELDIAIQLHNAIHSEKYGKQSSTREERVQFWLEEHKPHLKTSNARVERLSTIIKVKKNKK
jgi:hypothetical protein